MSVVLACVSTASTCIIVCTCIAVTTVVVYCAYDIAITPEFADTCVVAAVDCVAGSCGVRARICRVFDSVAMLYYCYRLPIPVAMLLVLLFWAMPFDWLL